MRGGGLMLTVANLFGQLRSRALGLALTAGYENVGNAFAADAPVYQSDHLLVGAYGLAPGWVRPHTLGGVDHDATPPAMLNTAERDLFVDS